MYNLYYHNINGKWLNMSASESFPLQFTLSDREFKLMNPRIQSLHEKNKTSKIRVNKLKEQKDGRH